MTFFLPCLQDLLSGHDAWGRHQPGRPFMLLQEMKVAGGGSAWAPAASAGWAKKYPAVGRKSEEGWQKEAKQWAAARPAVAK